MTHQLKAGFLLLLSFSLIGGCASVQFVAPYDEVIYEGLTDYKGELNLHVKNMADLSGTPAGTYEANQLKYNEMETRLDLLIDRARSQSTGNGCLLSPALKKKVDSYLHDKAPVELSNAKSSSSSNSYGCTEILLVKVKQQLADLEFIHGNTDRCELRASGAIQVVEVEVDSLAPAENSSLDQVVDQAVAEVVESLRAGLTSTLLAKLDGVVIESTSQPEGTAPGERATVSCLRPATAETALAISNQSINAAWVVENAKRQGAK